MIFIHNYSPKYTAKLIELGIMKKGDGIKITQHYATPENMRFNEIAKPDGELFEIIKNYSSCFYIDRLQGGTFYSEYDYDELLLNNMSDYSIFLGFQLHELGTTRMMDWNRVDRQLRSFGYEKTEANIIEAVRAVSANKTVLHFSQGKPSEYAEKKMPETLKESFEDVLSVLENAKERTGGRVFNCDGGTMIAANDTRVGLKLSFIEVGCQTEFSRPQYALRRGASRSVSGKWGAYLEPWSHMTNGTTCYCFMRDGSNEWFVQGEGFAYNHDGERGGSSMSYAERMMYYSLFAGADYFAEEWGQSNTFYDFESFELSPYGKIKKKFCEFAQDFKNVRPFAPVAIVIPREYGVFNTHTRSGPYGDLPDDTSGGRWLDTAKRVSALMYGGSTLGSEDIYFTTGRYGSIFDIIFEDSYRSPTDEYSLIIDLSGKLSPNGSTIIDGWDVASTEKALDSFVAENLPVDIIASGEVDYSYFENDGRNYLAIYNHNGVTKSIEQGEVVNPDATVTLSAKPKKGATTRVFPIRCDEYSVKEGALFATLSGGEFLLLEYESK